MFLLAVEAHELKSCFVIRRRKIFWLEFTFGSFAGIVAGLHPNPVPYADVVTTTIHKTIGGGRGGMILCTEELQKKIDSAVFPGQQGGPLEHVIAGKAVALRIAASEPFRERQERTVAGAKAVAAQLLGAGGGVNVLTGGTDVHLVLCDLRESALDGQQAEDRLAEVGITVNRNAVPFDPRPPAVSSGLRIGTPALATRGLQTEDFVRTLLNGRQPLLSEETIEQRVVSRLARQEILTRWPLPMVTAVIDESVLRRRLGGRKVRQGQLERLLKSGRLRNITLQVLRVGPDRQ